MLTDDVDDWQSRAMVLHERLRADGHGCEALAVSAQALERLHRELGAPPAMDRWIDLLDDDVLGVRSRPADEIDRRVFRAAPAVLGRRPAHPALPLWHARALAFVRMIGANADDAIQAASFSFEYAVRAGNFREAGEIVRRARAHAAGASAAMQCSWQLAEALEAWLSSDHPRARNAVGQALALGGGYAAWEQGASAALSQGDLADADHYLDGMARTLNPRRTQDVAHSLFLASARARLGGDNSTASARIDDCLAQDATNIAPFFTTLWQLGRAHVHIACGRHRQAAALLAIVLGRATSHYWTFLHFSALMSRAWLRVRQRRTSDASRDLQNSLALAKAGGYRNCDPWWDREAIGEVAHLARGTPSEAALTALLAREAA